MTNAKRRVPNTERQQHSPRGHARAWVFLGLVGLLGLVLVLGVGQGAV